MTVTVGDVAPGFTLPGVHDGTRGEYSLAQYRGRAVLLVFYPGDNTPICTRQLNAYTADLAQFEAVDATILALSPQDLDSHEGFARAQGGFGFPLLADLDKAVGDSYGVLGPVGFYRRSIVVVDPSGLVSHVHRGHAASTFRPTAELLAALRA